MFNGVLQAEDLNTNEYYSQFQHPMAKNRNIRKDGSPTTSLQYSHSSTSFHRRHRSQCSQENDLPTTQLSGSKAGHSCIPGQKNYPKRAVDAASKQLTSMKVSPDKRTKQAHDNKTMLERNTTNLPSMLLPRIQADRSSLNQSQSTVVLAKHEARDQKKKQSQHRLTTAQASPAEHELFQTSAAQAMIMKNRNALGSNSYRKTPGSSSRNNITTSSIEVYNVKLPKSMIKSTPTLHLEKTTASSVKHMSISKGEKAASNYLPVKQLNRQYMQMSQLPQQHQQMQQPIQNHNSKYLQKQSQLPLTQTQQVQASSYQPQKASAENTPIHHKLYLLSNNSNKKRQLQRQTNEKIGGSQATMLGGLNSTRHSKERSVDFTAGQEQQIQSTQLPNHHPQQAHSPEPQQSSKVLSKILAQKSKRGATGGCKPAGTGQKSHRHSQSITVLPQRHKPSAGGGSVRASQKWQEGLAAGLSSDQQILPQISIDIWSNDKQQYPPPATIDYASLPSSAMKLTESLQVPKSHGKHALSSSRQKQESLGLANTALAPHHRKSNSVPSLQYTSNVPQGPQRSQIVLAQNNHVARHFAQGTTPTTRNEHKMMMLQRKFDEPSYVATVNDQQHSVDSCKQSLPKPQASTDNTSHHLYNPYHQMRRQLKLEPLLKKSSSSQVTAIAKIQQMKKQLSRQNGLLQTNPQPVAKPTVNSSQLRNQLRQKGAFHSVIVQNTADALGQEGLSETEDCLPRVRYTGSFSPGAAEDGTMDEEDEGVINLQLHQEPVEAQVDNSISSKVQKWEEVNENQLVNQVTFSCKAVQEQKRPLQSDTGSKHTLNLQPCDSPDNLSADSDTRSKDGESQIMTFRDSPNWPQGENTTRNSPNVECKTFDDRKMLSNLEDVSKETSFIKIKNFTEASTNDNDSYIQDNVDNKMNLIKEIQSIMLACADSNSYGQDDSVEQLVAKNRLMKENLSIVISTIEDQMSAIGHDMSSFFDSVAVDQKDEKTQIGRTTVDTTFASSEDHNNLSILQNHNRNAPALLSSMSQQSFTSATISEAADWMEDTNQNFFAQEGPSLENITIDDNTNTSSHQPPVTNESMQTKSIKKSQIQYSQWSEARFYKQIQKIREKIRLHENFIPARELQNQLTELKRKLGNVQSQKRDYRIFYKNRFKSLKHVVKSKKRQDFTQKRDETDLKYIKDEVFDQIRKLIKMNSECSQYELKCQKMGEIIQEITQMMVANMRSSSEGTEVEESTIASILDLIDEVAGLETQESCIKRSQVEENKCIDEQVEASANEYLTMQALIEKELEKLRSDERFQQQITKHFDGCESDLSSSLRSKDSITSLKQLLLASQKQVRLSSHGKRSKRNSQMSIASDQRPIDKRTSMTQESPLIVDQEVVGPLPADNLGDLVRQQQLYLNAIEEKQAQKRGGSTGSKVITMNKVAFGDAVQEAYQQQQQANDHFGTMAHQPAIMENITIEDSQCLENAFSRMSNIELGNQPLN